MINAIQIKEALQRGEEHGKIKSRQNHLKAMKKEEDEQKEWNEYLSVLPNFEDCTKEAEAWNVKNGLPTG